MAAEEVQAWYGVSYCGTGYGGLSEQELMVVRFSPGPLKTSVVCTAHSSRYVLGVLSLTASVGGQISAWIPEHGLDHLDSNGHEKRPRSAWQTNDRVTELTVFACFSSMRPFT